MTAELTTTLTPTPRSQRLYADTFFFSWISLRNRKNSRNRFSLVIYGQGRVFLIKSGRKSLDNVLFKYNSVQKVQLFYTNFYHLTLNNVRGCLLWSVDWNLQWLIFYELAQLRASFLMRFYGKDFLMTVIYVHFF